ncbi:MAG: hypothetical protein M5U01_25985 [Ardenticatenaceae bacterium]|nr:hypothetical protein [Ardenticatenaceae bacterium]
MTGRLDEPADQVVSGLVLAIYGIGLVSFLGQRRGPEGRRRALTSGRGWLQGSS